MKSSELSFHIETLGCPKNVVDSRTMRIQLLQNGFTLAKNPEKADVILINTCSFIKEAQENTIDTIFNTLNISKKKKNRKIGVIGCFAQQFPSELQSEIPEVDFIMGTGRYHEIAQVLSEKFSIELLPVRQGDIVASPTRESLSPYAYFRVAQGCSRKCSFCIIPTIRGSLVNYNMDDIKKQYHQEMSMRNKISPLREAIFVSQDTISTPMNDIRQFVEYFSNMDHIYWIRLHYLFPDRRIFEILNIMRDYPKIVPYLDIPFQHVSVPVLRAMNRPDDPELFYEIIEKSLKMNPDMEIRTAFIIGYPGETEKDVESIADFLEIRPIHKCAFFRYSHENGTSAYIKSEDNIPENIKAERINYLRNIHLKSRAEFRSQWIGRKTQLMLDEINPKEIIARRAQDSPDIDEVVYISGTPDLEKNQFKSGDIVEARLETAMEYDWIGEIIQ